MIILDSRRKIFAKTSKNDSQILKRRPILIWRPFSSPESIATYLFVTIDDIYDKLSSTETSFLRKLFQDPSLLYIMYNFSSLWDESETGERESIIEYFAQCFEWWSYRYCGEHIKWVVWACKDLLETFKSCRQLCSFNKITIYNADLRCIFPWCNGRREKSGRFRRETDRFYELRMLTYNVHIYGRFSSISLCTSLKIEGHRRRFRIFQSKFGEYDLLQSINVVTFTSLQSIVLIALRMFVLESAPQ